MWYLSEVVVMLVNIISEKVLKGLIWKKMIKLLGESA